MADEFQDADSGASKFYPIQCSALRKSGHVLIKNRPCKIVDMSTSKTGKHGHAKVHLVAIDIFTGKKLEELCPSTHNLNVPVVVREEYQVLDIAEDGFACLLDKDGETREDIKVGDDEQGTKIRESFDAGKTVTVTVISSMDEEAISAFKEVNED